jgi:hypothetical protein
LSGRVAKVPKAEYVAETVQVAELVEIPVVNEVDDFLKRVR